MKRAQVLGMAIAGVCGIGAFVGVKSLVNRQPTVIKEEVTTNMTQVLVAKTEIGLGQMVAPDNFRWQEWPQANVNSNYVQRYTRPNAIGELTGAYARSTLGPGDPITPHKLVKAGEGGVLAAIVAPGMRAISTRIKEETGVGKLIQPGDHVDVILTVRKRGRAGGDEHVSDTLFRNVRVLAIGQLIEARDGKKIAEGNTATFELSPLQAEELAAANAKGEISLALRSIADIAGGDERQAPDKLSNTIKVLRYGAKSRVYGVGVN
jgi:pilus assembly protein CpaB